MGGGIIIKPALDATGVMSVATVTFLSGCAAISMSSWSVGKTLVKRESVLELGTTPYLAVGAALGGLAGRQLFRTVAALFPNRDMAGGVQALLLFLVTLLTLLYTLKKEAIRPRQIQSRPACLILGGLLGVLGSFLGIGGGPFNVAALCYFFSMPTQKAAQNSLLIILLSQVTSTLRSLLADGVPQVDPVILVGMVILAVAASEVGRRLNQGMDNRQATRWQEAAMLLIMGINLYNVCKYLL